MAKKEKKIDKKPFKVQGWKTGEPEEPLKTDMSFEELIKLSVSGTNKKDKRKSN